MKKNLFQSVEMPSIQRNTFDLTHDNKLSLDMGTLVPTCCFEVVPGDKISMSLEQMVRFAPLVAPVMHNIDVYVHAFFVPNRILWSNWEDFITGGEDGTANPVFPFVNIPDPQIGTIPDYLDIPTGTTTGNVKCSALPFLAYNAIYNDYYRDQNQVAKRYAKATDGDNSTLVSESGAFGTPYRRAWEHDYFTSCLPFAQKGPAVTIPIGTTAPILFDSEEQTRLVKADGTRSTDQSSTAIEAFITPLHSAFTDADGDAVKIDNSRNLRVDLSNATASTINDLREAVTLQEFFERMARGGSRYIEVIKSHFNVTSSDARLQRPEYLGGSKNPVMISEVLQTSGTADENSTPQGNLAGHAIGVGGSYNFTKRIEEHGQIICIMSVRPKTAYFQGLPKQYTKFNKLDYYWPSFAHLGEQEVLNSELFYTGSEEQDNAVFGYQSRYAEYKYMPSKVHGDFRETLEYWHLARKFEDPPALNQLFIECDPSKRIFAVQDLPDAGTPDLPIKNFNSLYCHIFHKIHASRPMPYYGTPNL